MSGPLDTSQAAGCTHSADYDAGSTRRRTEAEARKCSQSDCPGDGRYQPPGRGHLPGCEHNAVRWVWEEIADKAVDPAESHWTSWPPVDDGPLLTDEEQMALVTAVRVQQVARIIARDTGANEDAALASAWSLARVGLLATPWRGETRVTSPGGGRA